MTAAPEPPDERIDALFRLPPDGFVAARNALAAELRKARDVEAAERIKALVKPSASAWLVNQLYWECHVDFERLLAAGAQLRADQQRGLQGGGAQDLAAATRERRAAVAGLLRQAALILASGGRPATPALLKRVETTLEAIASLGGAGDDARLGRLARDLDPPGFDALLGLTLAPAVAVPAAPPAPPEPKDPPAETAAPPAPRRKAVAPEPPTPPKVDRRALERARAAVSAALDDLERSRLAAGEAEAGRAAAAARARQTVAEVTQAGRRLREAEKHAERADVALQRARTRKETADAEVARAQEALSAARRALGEFS